MYVLIVALDMNYVRTTMIVASTSSSLFESILSKRIKENAKNCNSRSSRPSRRQCRPKNNNRSEDDDNSLDCVSKGMSDRRYAVKS